MLPLLCASLLMPSAHAAASDPVAWYLSLPRPAGVSLDLTITEGAAVSHTRMDVVASGGALKLRADVVDGQRHGQSALADLGADGKETFYAFQPALGVNPVKRAQMEKSFRDLGVSLSDLIDLLRPAASGWTGTTAGSGASLQGPADTNGCRDTYTFPSLATPLPSTIAFCADGAWGAHRVDITNKVMAGTATLPGSLHLVETGGRDVTITVAVATTERWKDATRFDKATLGK